MNVHSESAVVQEQACVALRTLCFKNKTNRAIVRKAGGVDAVQASMKNHRDAQDVVYWGKKALDSIRGPKRASVG